MIQTQVILSDFIAIGVVNPSDALTSQQGLNAEVLVEGPFEDESESRRKIRIALSKLDHKTVGRDIKVNDKSEASLPEITEWLFEELLIALPETTALTMKFGNNLTCEIRKG
jgi:hypothetical protein